MRDLGVSVGRETEALVTKTTAVIPDNCLQMQEMRNWRKFQRDFRISAQLVASCVVGGERHGG